MVVSSREWAFLPPYSPIVTPFFPPIAPSDMNYDELFSLEQKAIFQHCSINEPIADLFFQIQAQDVP